MVSAAATPQSLDPPNPRLPAVDDKGLMTIPFTTMLTGIWNAINGGNIIIPCTVGGSANNIVLTPLVVSPLSAARPGQAATYKDYSTWAFVATATSTTLVTGGVTGLALNLKIFKTNGSAQATTGDVVSGNQYFLTFVDSLNAGAGGFVLR
jgi:hypothetical protein